MITQVSVQDSAPADFTIYQPYAPQYQPFIQALQQAYRFPAVEVFEVESARREIAALTHLEENWDGYGALRIQEQTARNARAAADLILCWAPAPEIAPNPNGTISMEWKTDFGSGHLEIGQTRYSFYVDRHDGGSLFDDGSADRVTPYLGFLVSSTLFQPQPGTAALTHIGENVQSTG